MRFPQVVVYEQDGRLAHVLSGLVTDKRWVLRESRQIESCVRTLMANTPTVLVLALPPECGVELALLDRVAQNFTSVRIVVVVASSEIPSLPGLAWDLGADCVVSPPLSLTMLPEIVGRLMPVPESAT